MIGVPSKKKETSDMYRCPMPTIREHYPDPDAEAEYWIEIFDEPLFVKQEFYSDLGDDDLDHLPKPGDGPNVWEVRCYGGHVLLNHDTEDRDCPINPEQLKVVLDALPARACSYGDKQVYGELWGGVPSGTKQAEEAR